MDLNGKTILFIVAEDWYFLSHRFELALAAKKAGARVALAARFGQRDNGECRHKIEGSGIKTFNIPFDRAGIDPLKDIRTFLALRRVMNSLKPDIVHTVALKPMLYGGTAARLARVPALVNAAAGLGYIFISRSFKARILRPLIRMALRYANSHPNGRLIVQNMDDAGEYASRIGVKTDRIALIRGSGVDTDRFHPVERDFSPEHVPLAVCVSRMLKDKGIVELVQAARLLKARKVPIRIALVGPTDSNPAAVPEATLKDWADEGIVEVLGPRTDIDKINEGADIAVLPSYREGLPKSLLEAAASGLPLIATDVPGCREVCVEGTSGILVPPRDAEGLADALQKLAQAPSERLRLGRGARELAERDFALPIIIAQTLNLYSELSEKSASS